MFSKIFPTEPEIFNVSEKKGREKESQRKGMGNRREGGERAGESLNDLIK